MNRRSAHTITVAAELPADAEALAAAVLAEWPGHFPPSVEALSLDALFDRLGSEAPGITVALALAPGGRAAALITALRAAEAPAVLLTEARHPSNGDGILVEPPHAPRARLAAELYALLERQPAFDALRREVRLLSISQGGARGELDRIHSELNMAAIVQQESLPKSFPEAAGLDFAVLFRPCGYVSGDIYDVARLDERTVGFFIADAVGHGVPAALLTMVIAKSLRTTDAGERGRRIIPPGEALARLNEEMIRAQRGDARFATAIYGVIDERTRRITLACAGHPAPLLVGRGQPRPVAADGPLLGVFRNETFGESSLTLAPDESLLLFSDGFETAFPDAGGDARAMRRGNQNYLRRLAALPWPSASEGALADAFAALAEQLDLQDGSLHQVDDVTALAIGPRPSILAQAA